MLLLTRGEWASKVDLERELPSCEYFQKSQLEKRSYQFPLIYTSLYVQAVSTSDFNLEIKSSVYVA